MAEKHESKLIINKKEYEWPQRVITGTEIKVLANSPADWVVNEIVPGPGGDPEISNDQKVDLDQQSEPKGIKRFTTRKATTSPGAA
ncbi:multiubiquitin domain-containing protein [Hyphomicrobium denitrificans]|nr:multiubiquitin domain-containing protein [Hyphomicrobium denitrificans]